MKKAPDRVLVERLAARVLQDNQIGGLPVDPLAIANDAKIVVQAMPGNIPGVSGMLMFTGTTFGILYATHIESEGFRRFSVAHELGHYFIPGHPDALFPKGTGTHESRGGFTSSDPFELEADHFAAALLMPEPYFAKSLRLFKEDGLAAIEYLSENCGTSLTATAIRYVERTSIPAAVVVSTGQRIDFSFMSEAMQEFNIKWLRKGSSVPYGVLTEQFNLDQQNITKAQRREGTSSLRDWFGYHRDIPLREEVLGLGRYGKTLTVLTSEVVADEDEEDECLEESWKPRWR